MKIANKNKEWIPKRRLDKKKLLHNRKSDDEKFPKNCQKRWFLRRVENLKFYRKLHGQGHLIKIS